MKTKESIPGSFRDPSGFLFYHEGSIYRQISTTYKQDYDHLMNSGLYKALSTEKLLIPHEEVENIESLKPEKSYKIIKPELIPFISYPYEWCFSQLKDAALTTLSIQKIAVKFGMSIKDCSAYNIQFKSGKPILIDSLSFEKYKEGHPWVAYRQFCQHFLAPLSLMSIKDIRLNQLFKIYIDGIPLDLASTLLPFNTYLNFSLLSHIHLHAKSQKHFADKAVKKSDSKISHLAFLGLIDNLESAVKKIKLQKQDTEWADYYDETNYSEDAFNHKKQIITDFLNKTNPKDIWDLGANTGVFSRIAASRQIQTISFDIDPLAVERNYLQCLRDSENTLLPLLIDLTNPSPGIGWENKERMSLFERGPADMVFALALIHHLAISNNVPLNKISYFFSKMCDWLIIEFIPKSDSQVQRLLATREDIFPDYTKQAFEKSFNTHFTIQTSIEISDSERTLYLMKNNK